MKKQNILPIILFILFFYIPKLYSSDELLFVGCRAVGLGGAYTAIAEDIETIGYNPAGLAGIKQFNIFTSTKRLYSIDDLKHNALAIGYGINQNSAAALMYEDVGYSEHKESNYKLGYAQKINRFLTLGAALKLYKIEINNFGNDNTIGLDIGCISRIYENLYFGAMAKNINNPQIGREIKDRLNRAITAGLAYSDNLLTISVDATKENDLTMQIRTGLELKLLRILALRYGYNNDPKRNFYGIGINYKQFDFGFAMFAHPQLEDTKQFSLNYKFGK
ncbi:MAG TPA: hypothetical protein PLM75_03290 [bacterium]|nr:hypothetical protein [bacterium]HPP86869.1 hypothetical protein [bacterium]